MSRPVRKFRPMFAMILSAFLIPEPPETIATFEGKVVSVADGDTITVLVDRKQVKVRLEQRTHKFSADSAGVQLSQSFLASEPLFPAPQFRPKDTISPRCGCRDTHSVERS